MRDVLMIDDGSTGTSDDNNDTTNDDDDDKIPSSLVAVASVGGPTNKNNNPPLSRIPTEHSISSTGTKNASAKQHPFPPRCNRTSNPPKAQFLASTLTGVHLESSSSSDDEEEEGLDVAVPKHRVLEPGAVSLSVARAARTKKPRLSSTGASPADPVDLVLETKEMGASCDAALKPTTNSIYKRLHVDGDEDSDEDDEDSDAALLEALSKRRKQASALVDKFRSKTTRTRPVAVAASLKPLSKCLDLPSAESDSSSPSTSTRSTTKAVLARKKVTNPYAKEQREQEKAEKLRKKEEERAAKLREKEAAKELKEMQRKERKEEEEKAKQQKKRAREEVGQARGKFADAEVAVLLEPGLFNHETLPIKQAFQEQGYHVNEYPSGLSCLTVQWIRCDYLRGGAKEALQMAHARRVQEFDHLDSLVVVFDCPHDFIELIQQDDGESDQTNDGDDEDYPKLEEWLLGLVAGWRAAWRKTSDDRPRIYLLLYQVPKALDRAWVNYNRSRGGRNRGPPPPNAEQLYDAILWMLIQFQIEVIHCESPEDVPKELTKMTRFLCNARYQAQTTELACVHKIKAQVNDMAPSYDRAVDCWMRQVQQMPRVSSEMARCLTQYYPTARSLWQAYQNPNLTVDEKKVLVAQCFGTRNCSQIKLAKAFYLLFTSTNPEQLLTT